MLGTTSCRSTAWTGTDSLQPSADRARMREGWRQQPLKQPFCAPRSGMQFVGLEDVHCSTGFMSISNRDIKEKITAMPQRVAIKPKIFSFPLKNRSSFRCTY